jgi:hypothetical protein
MIAQSSKWVDHLNVNVIAENLFAQVDEHGKQFQLLHEIMEHEKVDTTIPVSQGFITSRLGD